MSGQAELRGLMALPAEVLVMVLARVPLLDLANVRVVCRRLQQLVDGSGGRRLWAAASMAGLHVTAQHRALVERAADCGNQEALIKLALAYLYNQGVPKGAGAGTLNSYNGLRAADYLCRLERLSCHSRPLSWLLIRPPWSNSVSNKMCVYHKMIEKCLDEQAQMIPGFFYSLGQTVTFLEADGKESEAGQRALDWFERGASHTCPFSALQVWRNTHKHNLVTREIQALRSLRKIVAMSNGSSSLEAKLELCAAYAGGHFGSAERDGAFQFIREVMTSAQSVLSRRIFRVQGDITNIMRYITVDWMAEIAELKSLSPHTLHQAVTLFDSYLLTRQVHRTALQLLGVTAILVASRWSGSTMLTIRESSWLTENTYSYEEVVRMMAELLGAFRGDIRMFTICDYLDVLMTLTGASASVSSMAHYLSESLLLHPEFWRFSAAHLAAACLLDAHIFLKQDFPWQVHMEQATGFSLCSLRKCCVMIYHRCLTKEFAVTDHRGVELCSIANRYSHQSYQSVSKHEIMTLAQLTEKLGISQDSLECFMTPKPKSKVKDKLLSFLSDSCYLSSPLWLSESGSESELESEYEDGEGCEDFKRSSGNESDSACCLQSQSSSASVSFCSLPSTSCSFASPDSSLRVSLQQRQRSFPPSPLSLPPSPTVLPHSSLRALSTSAQQLQSSPPPPPTAAPASISNLSHAHSLGALLVPAACFSRQCAKNTRPQQQHLRNDSSAMPPPSSLLTRHSSLNSCDLPVPHCSGLSDKADRAHVSCPDFHSYSTDMELGLSTQEEGNEMDTHNPFTSASDDSPIGGLDRENLSLGQGGCAISNAHFMEGLDFHLPPSGEPQFLNFNPRPEQHSAPPGKQFMSQGPLLPGSASTPPPNMSHKTFSQPSSHLSNKSKSGARNPLQSLHNMPCVLNGRQSAISTGHKGGQASTQFQDTSLSLTKNRKF